MGICIDSIGLKYITIIAFFVAVIVTTLVDKSPFRLASEFFWHILLISESFFAFWLNRKSRLTLYIPVKDLELASILWSFGSF